MRRRALTSVTTCLLPASYVFTLFLSSLPILLFTLLSSSPLDVFNDVINHVGRDGESPGLAVSLSHCDLSILKWHVLTRDDKWRKNLFIAHPISLLWPARERAELPVPHSLCLLNICFFFLKISFIAFFSSDHLYRSTRQCAKWGEHFSRSPLHYIRG